MSADSGTERHWTTVAVRHPVHERLKSLRPYDSMSFSDLIDDMADTYEENPNQE
jgi:predicted CopG family antitoxin